MTQQHAGFLPFGSTDNRVKCDIDLTSEAGLIAAVAAGDIESYTILGTGSSFTDKGFNAGATTGGLRVVFSDAVADELNYHAEIALEVESKGITTDDPTTTFSYGEAQPAVESRIIDAFTSVAYAGGMQVFKLFNQIISGWTGTQSPYTEYVDQDLQNSRGNSTAYAIWPHSEMHGDFLTININVKPGFYSVGLDQTTYTGANKSVVPRQFKVLVLGSDRGIDKSFPYGIRRIQVAARDVVIPCIPILRHVAVLSDSMFDSGNMATSTKEGNANIAFRQVIEQRGFRCGRLSVDENAGFTVAQLSARIPTVLGTYPSVILYRGMTNNLDAAEAAGIQDGTVLTQLKADVELMLGLNGNPSTTVERLIMGTAPKRVDEGTSLQASLVLLGLQIYQDLKTWYDATYGDGRLLIADVYTAVGGDSITSGADPQTDILLDGTHMYPRGNISMGKSYANTLLGSI